MNDLPAARRLRDIADAAGVSVASVSKVLNRRAGVGEESRRKILGIAEQMGYQSRADRAGAQASGDATIVIPAGYYSQSQFYEDVVRGLLDEAAAQSMSTNVRLVSGVDSEAVREIDTILKADASAGLLLVGLDPPAMIDRIVQSGVPAVLVNGLDRTMRLSSVAPDNRSAGWLATQRLLAAGHREIVHVTFPHRLSIRLRLDGFRDALQEAGIAFDPDRHLLDLGTRDTREFLTPGAIERAMKSGRLDGVTAFFCSTDLVALGVLQGLQALGAVVPRDYSVVGIDDVTIAEHSRPALTTLRIERVDLGRIGVTMLRDLLANPNTAVRSVGTGLRLIERETVSPPRA